MGTHKEREVSTAVPEIADDGELVKLLLNSTGEGIYGADLDGSCIFANPACLKLLGYSGDVQLLGQNMHRLVHHTRLSGDPYPVEECHIYRAFWEHEGTHVDDEFMWRADWTSFPTEYWSYPVEREGELIGCVVTFTDISERVRIQAELQEKEGMVRSLLESTGEGIYGADLDGNCTFANPSCLQLLGYESDTNLLGRNMHSLIHHTRASGEPYPVKECRIYRAFWEHEGIHVDDEVMWRPDGTSFPAEYWSYPVERDGELVGCVVTFVDISKRLEIEEELRQAEKMAALGKLAAGLAHELNNPAAAAGRASSQLLDALRGLQDATSDLARIGIDQALWGSLTEWDHLLQRRSDEPKELSPLERSDMEEELIDWLESHGVEQGWELASTLLTAGVELKDLERIAATTPRHALGDAITWLCRSFGTQDLARAVVNSSHSISRLVDAAKSFSYMDQVQTIEVHQGIEDAVTMLASRLTDAIEIVREYGHDLPAIHVPASELNQVWMNVLDNALDAIVDRGSITIRTREDGSNIVVEIEDDGIGIPPDIENKIFDPFFTTKDVGEGTGLGLDVARRIVTVRCGGEISCRTQPGKTVFEIRLPRA